MTMSIYRLIGKAKEKCPYCQRGIRVYSNGKQRYGICVGRVHHHMSPELVEILTIKAVPFTMKGGRRWN